MSEVFTYRSADGTTDISARVWTCEPSQVVAVLQIAHGMLEYKERYDAFATWMAQQGIIVCANDHLGHGESVTSKDDWGFVAGESPSDMMVADMHSLRMKMQREYPDLPYFFLGHSMGSFLLRKYLAFHADGLAGAIVMGTGQSPEMVGKMGLFLTRWTARSKGWHFRSQKIQNLTYDKYYKRYDLTGNDAANSWLTRDEDIVKKYYSDPKCTYLFTLAGHKALFEAVTFCAHKANSNLIPPTLPLMLMSGAEDPVGGCGKGVQAAYDLLKKTNHTDVTMKLYPGARHEILNELEETKTEVYNDIKEWIYAHSKE